jgi:hypothetical protein
MNLTGSIRQVDSTTVGLRLTLGSETLASLQVSSNVALRANPTALIAAFLPIAAKMGYDLHIEGAIDTQAAANSIAAIDTLAGWSDTLTAARLVDCEMSTSQPSTKGVACLTSLGLDSFYSLHTRRDEITHFVLCRGFDISLDNTALWKETVGICRAVAASEGKQLIEVTTNIRSLSDPHLSWTTQYHGAALASFAHLLDEHFSHLLIPSSFTSDIGMAWGSHSQLDPLWSSSRLNFEHHELGVDRVEKMRAVADNPNAMRYLRVCVENLEAYNCGRCEKCIRTMCNAAAAGVADRLLSLPKVTPEDILGMPLRRPTCIQYHVENLRHLRELPDEQRRPDLEEAIETRLTAYYAA